MGRPFWNGPNPTYQTRTAFDNKGTLVDSSHLLWIERQRKWTDCRQIAGIMFRDHQTQQIVLRGVCIPPNLPTTSCGWRVSVGYMSWHKTGHLHQSWWIVSKPNEQKPLLPETTLVVVSDLSLLNRISSYNRLQQVTVWIFRCVTNSSISRESGWRIIYLQGVNWRRHVLGQEYTISRVLTWVFNLEGWKGTHC